MPGSDRRRKVLFVSHSPEMYGAPRSLYLLVEGLLQDEHSGVEPVVASFGAGALTDLLRGLGVETHVLRDLQVDPTTPRGRVLNLLNQALGLLQSIWILLRVQPDVVYVNSVARVEPALAGRWFGKAVVMHVRESRIYFEGPGRLPSVRRRALRSWADRIVAVSDAIGRMVLEYGVPEEKLAVVHNGIAPSDGATPASARREVREALGISEDAVLAVFVGNLTERKGIDFFLRIARRVADWTDRVHFLAVGGNLRDDFYLHSVAPLCRELGLEDRVAFTGRVSNVADHLAASDLFLMTSRAEPFARVNLEAMRASLPVVATEVDGNGESVVPGETGYLLPFGDEEAFARHVVRLVEDPELRRRLGRNGRERVERKFSLAAYVRACLEVIRTA